MTVDAAKFRADFPEFADESKYPPAMVDFWLGFAAKLLISDRWADVLDYGLELMTAHNLTVAKRNEATPGAIAAPVASKSVDKVSISYDTSAIKLENAGHWGATSYGIQFLQLARMVGAGGVQL